MIEPNGTKEVYDGLFFQKGGPFNQGNIFSFDSDHFIDACEKTIEKVKANPVNEEGLKLQEKFTYKKMVDKILDVIEKL